MGLARVCREKIEKITFIEGKGHRGEKRDEVCVFFFCKDICNDYFNRV